MKVYENKEILDYLKTANIQIDFLKTEIIKLKKQLDFILIGGNL